MKILLCLLCLFIFCFSSLVHANLRFVAPQEEDGGVFFCEEYNNSSNAVTLRKSGYLYRMTPVILTGDESRANNEYVRFKSSNGAEGFIRKKDLTTFDFKTQLNDDDKFVVHIHHHDSTNVELEDAGNKISNRSRTIPMRLLSKSNGYYFVDAIYDGKVIRGKIDCEGENRLYKFVKIRQEQFQLNRSWLDKMSTNAQAIFHKLINNNCDSEISIKGSIGADIEKFFKAALSINGDFTVKKKGQIIINSQPPFSNTNLYTPKVLACENGNPIRLSSFSAPDINVLFDANHFIENDFAKPYFSVFRSASANRNLNTLKMVELSRPNDNKNDYFSAISAIEREIRGDIESNNIDQIVYFILTNTIDYNIKN